MTLSLPHNRTSSRGVAKVGDRFIIFLDLDRIFSAEEQELNIS
jgi:chemotaxis signal transduction protein